MIEIEKAKKEFEKYVNNYDLKNPHIERKVIHSYKVVDIAIEIAESLNLDKEDVELASLIGLLHDIGRFEQLKIYGTYRDSESIDHADYGVEILFKDGYIRKFIEDDKYDNIIYKAIKNHNKYKIESGCNEKELLHCKIIRDADKTDIFRVNSDDVKNNENVLGDYDKIKKQKIGKEIREAFEECRTADSTKLESDIDWYLKNVAFIFDYNFPKGVEIVKEKGYIDILIDRIKDESNLNEISFIKKQVNEYYNRVL